MALDVGDPEEVLRNVDLVNQIRHGLEHNGVTFLFDHEGHIRREYQNLRTRSLGKHLVTVAVKWSAVTYATGKPTKKCLASLRSDGFDQSDVTYVAVAQHQNGVYVTTEEKHLRAPRRQCVKQGCSVSIESLEGLRSHLA
jgi:hypothetical protein